MTLRPETPPVLVAVAHGTRDPAGPVVVEQLLAAVRRVLPSVEVLGCYVELVEPTLPDVLAGLQRPAVVVPLLLSTGYHVRSDLPAAVARASAPVSLAAPLGPDALLTEALAERAVEAGAAPSDPLVVAAAGSSDPSATMAVHRAGRLLERRWGGSVTCGFVSKGSPGVATAVRAAGRRGGGRPVTVAPYLLAPGRFAHDLRECALGAGATGVAPVLGDHPRVVELVARRYGACAAAPALARTG